jgi:ABC-type Fe3+/spermidine/putrescine transport system ATPase subunit
MTKFVATFVGRASVLPGVMITPDRARLDGGSEWTVSSPAPIAAGQRVDVVVRPEALSFAGQGLSGVVQSRRYAGARTLFEVDVAGTTVEVEGSVDAAEPKQAVHLAAQRARAFPVGG